MTPSPDSPAGRPEPAARLALWDMGFRPFYLLAALFAALTISCWVAQFAGWTGAHMLIAGSYWHAHEMIFGYAFAVIAGFLFTAARNWTNEPTPSGALLGAIAALWLVARALVLSPWPFLAVVPDVALALAVAAGIGVPLFKSRNRRNYFFVALLIAFGMVNLCFYLAMAGWIQVEVQRGLRFGLDLVLLLMAVMGGRVIPMFTANAVRGASPLRYRWLEYAVFGSIVALLATDLLVLPASWTALAAAAGALAHGARLLLWQPWLTLKRPILWILHLSYAWIVAYLALRATAAMGWVPISLAIHALTIGAIGGLTLGMMTRTARGHSGRPLDAGSAEVACFVLIQFAVMARVFVPLAVPESYRHAIIASGVFWVCAYTLLAVRLAPMLLRPRIDGRRA